MAAAGVKASARAEPAEPGPTESARAEPTEPEPVERPYPRVTPTWAAMQLVPSHGSMIDSNGVHFTARWQLTPILYSYGVHPRIDPWRFFVVDPVARNSGSTELYVSPEYIAVGDGIANRFGARVGLRSYAPVHHRGEYLALSLGTAALRYRGETSPVVEAGAHVLFGVVGLLLGYSPGPTTQRWFITLQVRPF